MAKVVMVIDVVDNLGTTDSISSLNAKLVQDSSNAHEGVALARNLLDGILAGAISASVQVTVRGTDPSVSTNGTGSSQVTYTLK